MRPPRRPQRRLNPRAAALRTDTDPGVVGCYYGIIVVEGRQAMFVRL